MIIELSPEDEALIRKLQDSGAFSNVQEIIHCALETLEAGETWLLQSAGIINNKIARGLAELDRAEGISGEQSRARLQKKKAAWLKAIKEP